MANHKPWKLHVRETIELEDRTEIIGRFIDVVPNPGRNGRFNAPDPAEHHWLIEGPRGRMYFKTKQSVKDHFDGENITVKEV